MDAIDRYFAAEKEIKEHFGIANDWRVYPIDDSRHQFWEIKGDTIYSGDSEEDLADPDGINLYEAIVKREYPSESLTVFLIDTNADFNVFLAIFDNAKRREGVVTYDEDGDDDEEDHE